MTLLPKRIDPCPIIEAILELRYQSNVPPDAILGIIYSRAMKLFHRIQKLPILELPETIRSKDPNLRYQPYYEFKKKENVGFKVGPRVLTFSNTKPYQGWSEWFDFIKTVFEQLQESGIIKHVERVGIRYINFFQSILLDQLNLSIVVNEKQMLDETTSLRIELQDEDVLKVLQVVNNADMIINGKNTVGSVIDIDCHRNFDSDEDFFALYPEIAAHVHRKEKELFFGLLKPEILAGLNPIYEE